MGGGGSRIEGGSISYKGEGPKLESPAYEVALAKVLQMMVLLGCFGVRSLGLRVPANRGHSLDNPPYVMVEV